MPVLQLSDAKQVPVQVAGHSYSIHIGNRLLDRADWLQQQIPHSQVVIVTDEHVAAHWLSNLNAAFAKRELTTIVLPAGEAQKSMANFSALTDRLVAANIRRNAVVVALGGGVIGDLAGFVAACYQRGIDIAQIPTTLLAQVDSSVGGKTAINHPAGKNLIGAFHQPIVVISDLQTLSSLPQRERRSGLAEVVKYGVIADPAFLTWLEQHQPSIDASEPHILAQAVARSCQIKAEIVASDPLENGRRAILNFGHTFAHAIEAELGYGTWLHGEAVAVGMVLATQLALRVGVLLQPDLPDRLQALLAGLHLPTQLPHAIDCDALIAHMQIDKKNLRHAIRFVLPVAPGDIVIKDDIDEIDVLAVLRAGI